MSTYLFDNECGENFTIFHKILKEYGWTQLNRDTDQPDFLYLCRNIETGLFSKRNARRPCKIKNVLDGVKYMDEKDLTYYYFRDNFPEICQKYMPYSEDLKLVDKFSTDSLFGKIWILKPIDRICHSGVDIFVVTNDKEFQYAKRLILTKYKKGLVSKYIDNPLLFDGYKFHIRNYFLVRYKPFYFEMSHFGKLITATKPYMAAQYSNRDIHDTHLNYKDGHKYFPSDYPFDSKIIQKQFDDFGQYLGKMCQTMVEPYAESSNGFHLFGLAFMITDKFEIQFLEANIRPGGLNETELIHKKRERFYYLIFDFIHSRVFMDVRHIEPHHYELILFDRKVAECDMKDNIISNLDGLNDTCKFTLLKKIKFTSRSKPKTYLISGSCGLDHRELHKLLQKNGFVLADANATYIDYIHQETYHLKFEKSIYNKTCFLKNIIGPKKEKITDKQNLYQNFQRKFHLIANKHFARTWGISVDRSEPVMNTALPLIIKPVSVHAGAGKDIIIVSSDEELMNAKQKLFKKYSKLIACEYLQSPILFMKRKFHLRIYLLVNLQPIRWSVFHTGKILTAALPYRFSDFGNKLIHDTHGKSTDKDYWICKDFNKSDLRNEVTYEIHQQIWTQMTTICNNASELIQDAEPYAESKHAYEVFGVDFMIDNDYTVKLLEINERIGIKPSGVDNFDVINGPWTKEYTDFSKLFFEWIYKEAIGPSFVSHVLT